MKKLNNSMLEGPLLPSILSYTLPIILTSFLNIGFHTADKIITGQFCGNMALAAVSAAGAPANLIVTLFMGLSVGVSVAVSQAIGAKNEAEVQKTVHTAVPTALIIGVVLTIFGLFTAKPLLRFLNTPESVLPMANTYLSIFYLGMTFNILYGYCAAILRAVGDTKSPLFFLALSGATNVVLNVIFVTLFHMDVAGVALATVISQAVSALLVIRTLLRRTDSCKLVVDELQISRPHLLKIIRIGLPAGIQSSLFAISNTVIQSSVNSFGEVFMSANAAAGSIDGYVYTTMTSFGQTAVNFVGQNHGARQYDRIRKVIFICLACVLVIGIPVGQLANRFSPQLLSMFIKDSPEAIAYGMIRISIVSVTYFLCGMLDVISGALRGLGASSVPMIVSVLGICGLRVGWIYSVFQIPEYHTPECLFFSYPLSWIVTLTVETVMLIFVYKKHKRIHEVSI